MSDKNIIHSESGLIHVALEEVNLDSNVISIEENKFHGYLNLRGSLNNRLFTDVVNKVLGLSLPSEPNTFIESNNVTCLWLGPDEWLLITAPDQQVVLQQTLLTALADIHAAVTDISGTNTMLDIQGLAARDLIAKGTPLDIHPSVFGVGMCAQTSWIKTGVTLYQYSDSPGFKIIIRRSFADYFGAWLVEAIQEFI